jgi:hypothetical protein
VPGYIHAVDIYNGETFSRVRSGAGLAWWIYHREVMWLEPQIVAEISYAEIVQGRLRAPVFSGAFIPRSPSRKRQTAPRHGRPSTHLTVHAGVSANLPANSSLVCCLREAPRIMPRPERLYVHGYLALLLFALVMIILAWVWHPF